MTQKKRALIAILVAVAYITSAFGQEKPNNEFVARNIQNHIICIRVAQLGNERSESQKIKSVANELIDQNRQMLIRLLPFADSVHFKGVDQHYLDSIIKSFNVDSIYSLNDSRAALTTGNTVTDSIGSGSTGSGNVSGQDTGTVAQGSSKHRNANYSEQGDYLYRNQPAIEALKDIDKRKGEAFNRQWLEFMYSMANTRLSDFQAEADKNQPGNLRVAVVQDIPIIRYQKNMLGKMLNRKDKPGENYTPGVEQGPTKRNTKGGS